MIAEDLQFAWIIVCSVLAGYSLGMIMCKPSRPEPPAWSLVDVINRAKSYPDTFKLPSFIEIGALGPGDCAKLIFETEDGSERMWVRITAITAPGCYVGTLANDPTETPLTFGDRVVFNLRHVAAVDLQAR